jgi:iron complex outermembrane receptor protein
MNISARHSMNNDVTVSVRGNLYGPYKNSKSGTLTSDDIVEYGRVTQWDADLSWDLSEAYRLTLGVNNLFDTMPDVDEGDGSCCGRSYRSGSVQDWQGTYYYVRGQINF